MKVEVLMEDVKVLGWKLKSVKSLFNFLRTRRHCPLINSITDWANKNKKQPFSVRNYFYKLLKQVNLDYALKQLLLKEGIDLSEFDKSKKMDETRMLLWKILDFSTKQSVFSACLKLSNNNRQLALKYQNKYRNTVANHPEIVESVLNEMHRAGVPTRLTFAKSNVFQMPKVADNSISEGDLNSLVIGVINLIKSETERKIELEHKKEVQCANNNLQKALIDNRRKDVLLEELKLENLKIKKQLQGVITNQKELQQRNSDSMLTIQSLLESRKHKALQSFVMSLLENSQENAR